jgi:hypothetical protein
MLVSDNDRFHRRSNSRHRKGSHRLSSASSESARSAVGGGGLRPGAIGKTGRAVTRALGSTWYFQTDGPVGLYWSDEHSGLVEGTVECHYVALCCGPFGMVLPMLAAQQLRILDSPVLDCAEGR